jgi:hypothetical protein
MPSPSQLLNLVKTTWCEEENQKELAGGYARADPHEQTSDCQCLSVFWRVMPGVWVFVVEFHWPMLNRT